MATAGSVILRAAVHLNDPNQLVYTTAVLLPFCNMALEELTEELGVYNVAPLRDESIVIEADIADTVLAQMPADYVEAISLFERIRGGTDLQWREVKEVPWVDKTITQSSEIIQWASRGANIEITAPTTDRDVMLRYIRSTVAITGTSTALDLAQSITFLGLVTARNAATDAGNSVSKGNSFETRINRSRDRLVRRLQGEQQGMGVRRRAYSGRG